MNLTARARAGELDPLIGRADELQRTLEILCRRRKNNPVFVGDAGVGKTALAEGLATRLLQDDVPELLEGRRSLLARHRRRCSPARASAATSRSASRRSSTALAKRPMPILFIDEIHSTVGAGATTGGTMDLATLIKPILTAGQLRVVGSTTHEEFKHIEKDRALARRLQKITDRRAVDPRDRADPAGPALALRSAPPRAATRTTRSRRPPSSRRGTCATTGCPTAPSTCSTKRARKMRLQPGAAAASSEAGASDAGRSTSASAQIEEVVARMARIPAKQASSSDKDRLQSARRIARARRVRPGRSGRARSRARSSARAPASDSPTARPAASCSPARPASARPSSPSSSRCTSATSSCATT